MLAGYPEVIRIIDPVDEHELRALIWKTLRKVAMQDEPRRRFPAINAETAHEEFLGDEEIPCIHLIDVRKKTDIRRMVFFEKQKLLHRRNCEGMRLHDVCAVRGPGIAIPRDRAAAVGFGVRQKPGDGAIRQDMRPRQSLMMLRIVDGAVIAHALDGIEIEARAVLLCDSTEHLENGAVAYR